jgi:hypothetical protein
MDFEQLAFIEKWRRRAVRGVVVGLDSTRGDVVLTLRAGDFGAVLDLRGRDETGAVRKQRLTLGDRIFVAFRYRVTDVTPGTGGAATRTISKGADVEATLSEPGELAEVEVGGTKFLVEGDLAAFSPGDALRFRIAEEGAAYVIPTRAG